MSSSTNPSDAPSAEYAENTFKSWPSLEKPTPDKSWTTWYQHVSASKKVHWNEIGIGQALVLTIANSAKDEPLMTAATYFWSNTLNAFLFNQGPMTPTLIDITMITGLDVTSSANPMSMNTKNQFDFKTKSIGGWSGYVAAYMGQGSVTPREHTTESSPPHQSNSGKNIEYASALDEEEIGEDVDQAVAEMSDTEKTPSASPKQMPPTPSAPVHFTRKKKTAVRKKSTATTVKSTPPSYMTLVYSTASSFFPPVRQSSSDQTPSAAGSHHIEEEEPVAPAIPVLADLFSFDIRDYLDEAEEDTSSKALAPLSDDVRKTLEAFSHRLEASLDNLVTNCGSIRARFTDIQALIPDDLADALTPAVYLEQHQFKLEKARQRLADRRERKDIEATIQHNRQLVHVEKSKLDQLSEGPIKSNIDRLEARKIDLLAQLQECNGELNIEHKKLADLPQAVEEQKARLKSAIKNVADMNKSLKVILGTDA
uniref:DUF1409 domain-containing protein n=1 Tax=Oryza meridionalis TaxID=40149 RepID=A0A0E0F4L6_9ORYZ